MAALEMAFDMHRRWSLMIIILIIAKKHWIIHGPRPHHLVSLHLIVMIYSQVYLFQVILNDCDRSEEREGGQKRSELGMVLHFQPGQRREVFGFS